MNIDPTENVKALVVAEGRRQDDMRNAEAKAVRREMKLAREYEAMLRVKESERLDAIRKVDAEAVAAAAAVAATQAGTLAATVASAATTLAAQQETTRLANEQALVTALAPIRSDLADVRRVQYEQAGQKTAGEEQRTIGTTNRDRLFAILGLLGVVILAVSPHIHG